MLLKVLAHNFIKQRNTKKKFHSQNLTKLLRKILLRLQRVFFLATLGNFYESILLIQTLYHKWQSYDVVFQRWSATDRIFCHFGPFLPFRPHPNNPKNQNFEKLKKTPGDIILHKCNKNHDHVLYCSLDMAHNRFNCYFSFWAIFYPFTSLTTQKIKI